MQRETQLKRAALARAYGGSELLLASSLGRYPPPHDEIDEYIHEGGLSKPDPEPKPVTAIHSHVGSATILKALACKGLIPVDMPIQLDLDL